MLEARKAFQLGQHKADSGAHREACDAFERAICANHEHGPLAHLGLALNNLEKFDEALVKIRMARQVYPKNLSYQLFEALILADKGDLNESKELIREALHISPENLLGQNILALILVQEGKSDLALNRLEQTGLCGNLDVLSRLMLETQKFLPEESPSVGQQKLVETTKNLKVSNPRFFGKIRVKILHYRGERLLEKKKVGAALVCLEKAYRLSPTRKGLSFLCGVALFHLNRFDEASSFLGSVTEKDYYFHQSKFYDAICLLKLDKLQDAEKVLKGLKDSPDLYDFQEYLFYFLGIIAAKGNNKLAALQYFRKAIQKWSPLLDEQLKEIILYRREKCNADATTPHSSSPPSEQVKKNQTEERDIVSTGKKNSDMDEVPENNSTENDQSDNPTHEHGTPGNDAPDQIGSKIEDSKNSESEKSGIDEEELSDKSRSKDAGESSEKHEDDSRLFEEDDEEESEVLDSDLEEQIPDKDNIDKGMDELSMALENALSEVEESLATTSASQKLPMGTEEREKTNLSGQPVPNPVQGIICVEIDECPGERIYILKNPKLNAYLRLNDRDRFIWRQMNGNQSLDNIAGRFFKEYGAFGFEQIGSLYQKLLDLKFLEQKSAEDELHSFALPEQKNITRWFRTKREALAFRFIGPDFKDNLLKLWFGLGGKCLGYEGVLIFLAALGGLGLALVLTLLPKGGIGDGYKIYRPSGYYSLALISLYLWNVIGSLIYELARASVVKLNRCEILKAGPAIRLGLLGVYADIRDYNLLSRRRRNDVLLSGLAVEFFFAGLCSFLGTQLLDPLNRDIFALGAILFILRLFVHCCPFIQSDLYQTAIETFNVSHLRRKTLHYLNPREWGPVWKKEKWGRKELPYVCFGFWCLVWLIAVASLGSFLLRTQLSESILVLLQRVLSPQSIFSADESIALLMLSIVVVPIVLFLFLTILYLFTSLRNEIRQMDAWKQPYYLVVASSLLSFGIAIIAIYTDHKEVRGGICFIGSLLGIILLLKTQRETGRFVTSRIAAALNLGAIASVLGLWGAYIEGTTRLNDWPYLMALGSIVGIPALAFSIGCFTAMLSTSLGMPWMAMTSALILEIASGYQLIVPAFGMTTSASTYPTTASLGLTMAAAWLFLLNGCAWWYAIRNRQTIVPYYESPKSETDTERLVYGFNYLMTSLLTNFKSSTGSKFAIKLSRKLKALCRFTYELEMGIEDNEIVTLNIESASKMDFHELTSSLQSLALFATEEGAKKAGNEGVRRWITAVHHHLPWEVRDLISTHLFSSTKWASLASPDLPLSKTDRISVLRDCFLFHRVSDNDLEEIASIVHSRHYESGQTIIQQSDPDNKVYIIQNGRVEVILEDELGQSKVMATLGRCDFFGESALLEKSRQVATVRAKEDVSALILYREVFERFIERVDSAGGTIAEAIHSLSVIQKMPLFEEFSVCEMNTVATKFQYKRYQSDENIVVQGETGDHFFIIHSGTVDIIVEGSDSEIKIRKLHAGKSFGEMALLNEAPRSATVRAVGPIEVYVLEKKDFFELLESNSFFAHKLAEESSHRAKELEEHSA